MNANTKLIHGHQFHFRVSHAGSTPHVMIDPGEAKYLPLAKAIHGVWLAGKQRMLDAVAAKEGVSVDGAAWFEYEGEEVVAGYFETESRVPRSLFEELVREYEREVATLLS